MSNPANENSAQKLNYPKTILAGFAFLGVSVAWSIYTPYLTKILDSFLLASETVAGWSARFAGSPLLAQFVATQTNKDMTDTGGFSIVPLLIGVVMTFIYVLGVIFQPIFGRVSDGLRSRWGKRRPFIVLLMPISALVFIFLPLTSTLGSLIAVILIFSFVMAAYRPPVVSLMPDLTPSALRSSGNAVISLMGGVGTLLGMVAGTLINMVYTRAKGIPAGQLNEFDTFPHVFIVSAVIMLVCAAVTLFVREQDTRLLPNEIGEQSRKQQKETRRAEKLSKPERRSLLFFLGGLFFLFSGTTVIQTFFVLFAGEILHIETQKATLLMALFAVFAAAGAVPAGAFGRKLGRKKTIMIGMAGLMVSLLLFFGLFLGVCAANGLNMNEYVALNNAYGTGGDHAVVDACIRLFSLLIYPVLAFAGFASMLVMVNAMPLVVEIGGSERVGTFTGYYYIASYSAQIASPILYGLFRIFSGSYLSLFYYCPVMFVVSMAAILFVKHGEAKQEQLAAA